MSSKEQGASSKVLRSTTQGTRQDSPKDSPKLNKGSESKDKSEKTVEKCQKDPKQPSIMDFQIEPHEMQRQMATKDEIKKFRQEMRALFKESDEKMAGRFRSIDDKFTKIFESLKTEVDQLKAEMTETKITMENIDKKVEDIEESLVFQTGEINDHQKNLTEKVNKAENELLKKIAELDDKLMLLEKHDRKYNLLFYGIQEDLQSDQPKEIIERMKRLFVEDLKIDRDTVERMKFAHGHRIPSRGNGPRPIIMRFASYQDRELVLRNAKMLAGTQRRIVVDLPEPMKRERNKLAKVAYEIRKSEKLQTRIKDKGLKVELEVRKGPTDRWEKRNV